MRSRISGRTAQVASVVALVVLVALGGATGGLLAAQAAQPVRLPGGVGVSRSASVSGLADVVGRPAPSGWRLTATRHYGSSNNASGYSAMVAPGRSDAWAFGGTNPGGGGEPAAERRIGGQWRSWPLPAHLSGFIGDASAPSSSDIWAVSYSGGYVLHWNGRRWLVARSWPRHNVLTGVTALSPTDVWVFGTTTSGIRGLGTWHFDGRTWTRAGGWAKQIYRADAVSRRDIWAVAANERSGFVEHYDGRSWRLVPTGRLLAHTRLDDVVALSHRDVWVVGNQQTRHGDGRLLIAHFDGRHWSRALTRWHADVGRLAPDGSGGVWVSADNAGASNDALIGHLPRRGRLTWVTLRHGLGNGITDIAVNRDASRIWLSGGYLTQAGGDAAIWSHTSGQVARKTAEAVPTAESGLAVVRSGPLPTGGRHQRNDPATADRPSRNPGID